MILIWILVLSMLQYGYGSNEVAFLDPNYQFEHIDENGVRLVLERRPVLETVFVTTTATQFITVSQPSPEPTASFHIASVEWQNSVVQSPRKMPNSQSSGGNKSTVVNVSPKKVSKTWDNSIQFTKPIVRDSVGIGPIERHSIDSKADPRSLLFKNTITNTTNATIGVQTWENHGNGPVEVKHPMVCIFFSLLLAFV